MKVIIGGDISIHPFAPGIAWDRMQLAVGLQRLGHEVYYVEEVQPAWCVDARGEPSGFEGSVNRALFASTMARFGLPGRSCQIYNGGEATSGLSLESLVSLARAADLLINISGHIKTEFVLSNVKRRAYLDQDPVYTQLWSAEYGKDLDFEQHEVFFTVGLNIGTPFSPIPDCGVQWHQMLPPVVLDYWPFRIDPSSQRYTTVASWGSFGDLCYQGEWYRSKYAEFMRFATLPGRVTQELEIALRRYRQEDDRIQQIKDNGWLLTSTGQISDLNSYRAYIQRSRGEIGIAKHAYVKACSGWFSERTAQYLASGKPVLTQSTGSERVVPAGRGLLTFNDLEEAAAGLESIEQDYVGHCHAARALAEEYLDYRKTLPKLLELATA